MLERIETCDFGSHHYLNGKCLDKMYQTGQTSWVDSQSTSQEALLVGAVGRRSPSDHGLREKV